MPLGLPRIAHLVALLAERGVPAAATLRGTGLDVASLEDATPEQACQACRNAIRLSPDPALALRVGARTHLSDQGLPGLLLLSCASLHEYLELALRYRDIAPALPALARGVAHDGTLRLGPPGPAVDWPDDLRPFLVEWQVMQQLTALHDAFGPALRPARVAFAHAAPADSDVHVAMLGCPCDFDAGRTEIVYPADALVRRPRLANPAAAALLQKACDTMLADHGAALSHAGRVERALRQSDDPGTSMKRMAAALGMTDRTLRRRLAEEGTSFSAICRQVQCRIATQQLRRVGVSIEEVAASSGFSDPANFRRAFIRWTSMSPAQFRRRHGA